MSEMIERVAEALVGFVMEGDRNSEAAVATKARAAAKVAIEAMREPTQEMLEGAWTETLAIVKEEVGDFDRDLLFADRAEVERGAIRKHHAMINAALGSEHRDEDGQRKMNPTLPSR